jgi:hypothetical protein
MSKNNKDFSLSDEFIKKHINMIKELYEGEIFLDNEVLNSKNKTKSNFVLFDKEWLDKWKTIVGYETLKEKCIKCKTEADVNSLINEVRNLFIQLNTKEKLDELGKMESSKLKKISSKKSYLNEESNFVPKLAFNSMFFTKSINGMITINSEISKGIIYIYEPFPEKNKEQKLILLYKGNDQNKDFKKSIITLPKDVNIKNVIKDLSKKNIEEILNQKEYNIKNINPISNKEGEKPKDEGEKKKKEIEDDLEKSKPKARRSSLKENGLHTKLDPENLLKYPKAQRRSVSFGQVNTFLFKKMKANFEEKTDDTDSKKVNKEEHKKFVEFRKKSIKNEFLLVKEMMKKDQNTIKELEDSDEEVKKNTDQNVKIGKEELNEEDSSERSNNNSNDSQNED